MPEKTRIDKAANPFQIIVMLCGGVVIIAGAVH
jgi:hypothetical protein